MEPKAITNARRLFAVCDYEAVYETGDVFEILSLIDKEFGGWPSWKHSTWNELKFDLSELLMKLNHQNVRPFYNVQTKIDYDYLRLPIDSSQVIFLF